ncbi:MAG: Rieske 2Fe-2S domain-containing protein, partial [Actinobacteria bacterium]|nr:Rieske 2Fe-2S domain-containing protein [Actinomycetota bacterium]
MASVSSDTVSAPLPAHWYADEKQARDERDLIFHRSWQVAGLSKDVREPQSMTTAKICGMPVVITRDGDGEVHAMLNVCPHRGAVIAQGSGPAKLLQCPNHAWVYGLDGKLKSAPRTEREDDYSCEGMDLKPVAVLEWGPLLLVNLDADA